MNFSDNNGSWFFSSTDSDAFAIELQGANVVGALVTENDLTVFESDFRQRTYKISHADATKIVEQILTKMSTRNANNKQAPAMSWLYGGPLSFLRPVAKWLGIGAIATVFVAVYSVFTVEAPSILSGLKGANTIQTPNVPLRKSSTTSSGPNSCQIPMEKLLRQQAVSRLAAKPSILGSFGLGNDD